MIEILLKIAAVNSINLHPYHPDVALGDALIAKLAIDNRNTRPPGQ